MALRKGWSDQVEPGHWSKGLSSNQIKSVVADSISLLDLKTAEGIIGRHRQGKAQYPKISTDALLKHGFSNDLVYSAIMKTVNSVCEGKPRVKDQSGKMVDPSKNRLIKLLRKPSRFHSWLDLMTLIVIYLQTVGRVPIEKVRSRAGYPVELWVHHPDNVAPVPDEENFISHYELTIDGVKRPVSTDDLFIIKYPDPTDQFDGFGPLYAAFKRIITDNESRDFLHDSLSSWAIPAVVVKTKIDVLDKKSKALVKRLKEMWRQAMGKRSDSRGEPLFLKQGMEVEKVGMNMEELAFPELNKLLETRILATLGVFPILVGSISGLEYGTMANFKEARQLFHEETISPIQRRIASCFTYELLKDFEDPAEKTGSQVFFDMSDSPTYRQIREQRRMQARADYRAQIITLEEARREMDYPDKPDGELFSSQPRFSVGSSEKAITDSRVIGLLPGLNSLRVKRAEGIGLLSEALGRLDKARKGYGKVHRWAEEELRRQVDDIQKIFDFTASRKSLTQGQQQQFLTQLETYISELTERVKQGEINDILAGLMVEAGESAGVGLGIEFSVDNPAVKKFIDDYVFRFALKLGKTTEKNVASLMARAVDDELTISQISSRLSELSEDWVGYRADRIARSEVIRSSNAGTKLSYQEAGIRKIKWLTTDSPCPYCDELNGVVIGIDDVFFKQGQSLSPEGASEMNFDYEDISYPPLHPNCECTILAEL